VAETLKIPPNKGLAGFFMKNGLEGGAECSIFAQHFRKKFFSVLFFY
jgi:hypothetical protein